MLNQKNIYFKMPSSRSYCLRAPLPEWRHFYILTDWSHRLLKQNWHYLFYEAHVYSRMCESLVAVLFWERIFPPIIHTGYISTRVNCRKSSVYYGHSKRFLFTQAQKQAHAPFNSLNNKIKLSYLRRVYMLSEIYKWIFTFMYKLTLSN